MNCSITSQRWDCGHTALTICDLASGKDRAAGQYAQLKPVKQLSEIIKKNEMQALPCITLSFYLSCVSFEGFSDGQCSSIGFSAVFSAQQKPQKSAGATSAAVGGGLCRHGDGWGSDAGANRENFSMRMKEWKKVVFSFLKKGGKEMVTQGTIKEEAYPHTEGHQKHRPPEMKRDRY